VTSDYSVGWGAAACGGVVSCGRLKWPAEGAVQQDGRPDKTRCMAAALANIRRYTGSIRATALILCECLADKKGVAADYFSCSQHDPRSCWRMAVCTPSTADSMQATAERSTHTHIYGTSPVGAGTQAACCIQTVSRLKSMEGTTR